VLGATGTASDPDVELKGFTVFGATQPAYTGAVAGPGNVVVNGALAVSSGAYFVGSSTFSNAGKIYVGDGSTGQLLSKKSDGALQWTSADAIGDNLGSHIATTTLNMAGWSAVNVSSINFKSNVFVSSASATYYGGVYSSTHVYVSGDVRASKLYGDGSGLTGLSGASPVGSALTSANVWVGNASNVAAAVAMSGEGSLSNTGAFTLSKAIAPTWTAAHIFSGAVTLGDGGDAISVNSSDWDITSAGAMTGITGITNDGVYTQSGTSANTFTGASTFSNTLTANGTLDGNGVFTLGDNGDTGAIDTNDWDITTTGAMSGITGITNNGAYTQSGTNANTFTGAVTASNAAGVTTPKLSLLANVELTSTTAANYGGVYISSHVYLKPGAKYYGDGSGLTGISGVSPVGSALTSANVWVGNASNVAAAVAMSGEGSLSNTGAFTLSKAIAPTWTAAHIFSGAVTLGDGGDAISVNSSDWDITSAGAMTGITGITNDGVYTQSGTSANTFTGASTFSNTLTANGTLDGNGVFTLGDNGDTGAIDTNDWDITTTGAMSGITGITNNGAYTQSGTNANTFTGAVTASNAAGVTTPKVKLLANVELSSTTAANYGGVYVSTHLYVAGQMIIAGGSPGVDKVLTSNAAGLAVWASAPGMPSGAIILYDGSTCPSGWTEVTSARSRVARGWDGVTAAGDSNVGGADTHSHTTDIASFASATEGAHTHGFTTGGASGTLMTVYGAPAHVSTYGMYAAHTHGGTTNAGSAHSHSVDPPSTASSTNSNLPAYRAFVFCKKS